MFIRLGRLGRIGAASVKRPNGKVLPALNSAVNGATLVSAINGTFLTSASGAA